MAHSDTLAQAETISIPVQGDCGHAFVVPLARLLDGQPFTCPVCGQPDQIDDDAIHQAEPQLRKLRESKEVDGLDAIIGAILAKIGR